MHTWFLIQCTWHVRCLCTVYRYTLWKHCKDTCFLLFFFYSLQNTNTVILCSVHYSILGEYTIQWFRTIYMYSVHSHLGGCSDTAMLPALVSWVRQRVTGHRENCTHCTHCTCCTHHSHYTVCVHHTHCTHCKNCTHCTHYTHCSYCIVCIFPNETIS